MSTPIIHLCVVCIRKKVQSLTAATARCNGTKGIESALVIEIPGVLIWLWGAPLYEMGCAPHIPTGQLVQKRYAAACVRFFIADAVFFYVVDHAVTAAPLNN